MIIFLLHDHQVRHVAVLGDWDNWRMPGFPAVQIEPGLWQADVPLLPPGRYVYKFLLDGERWQDDPANLHRVHDEYGGLNSVLFVPD